MSNFNKDEANFHLKAHKVSENTRRLGYVVKWGAIGWVGYTAVGKATSVNMNIDIFNNKIYFIIIVVLIISNILTFMWALSEKKLKEQKNSDMSDSIIRLEKLLDKNRTSSNMPKDGSSGE